MTINKEKFTQGKWTYKYDEDGDRLSHVDYRHSIYGICKVGEFRICSINYFEEEDLANAKLIEQAPNLYETLQKLSQEHTRILTLINSKYKEDCSITPDFQAVFEAEEALALARGEL